MGNTLKLALSAGHWMGEPGRRCMKQFDPAEHREWWLNQRVCNYIQERAEAYENFEILRVDDVTGAKDVSLADRANKANRWGADVYLAIHHNGGVGGCSGGGIVAYSYPGSMKGAALRDKLYEAMLAAGGIRGNRATPKTTANFAEVRRPNAPAVLLECGFMDSRTDVPIILSENYAKAMGYALADCLAGVYHLTRVPEKAEQKEDTQMTQEQFNQMMKEYLATLKDNDSGKWSEEARKWAVENGLIQGIGKLPGGSPNYAWEATLTREQFVTVLYRFEKYLMSK